MSYRVETIDGEDFTGGVCFGDKSRVELGDLPSMSMDQFGEFASQTIFSFLPSLNDSERSKCKELVGMVRDDVLEKMPVRSIVNPHTGFESMTSLLARAEDTEDEVERSLLHEAIFMSFSNNRDTMAELYEQNPFEIEEGKVTLGGLYKVSTNEFMHFALYTMRGGMLRQGWDENLGVPQSVAGAINKLESALAE